MSNSALLEKMNNEWLSLGIKKHFSKVHHFSSEKFKTKPSGLKGFVNWCESRDIQDENLQTLNRAIYVINLIQEGNNIEASINQAWLKYPVCKR